MTIQLAIDNTGATKPDYRGVKFEDDGIMTAAEEAAFEAELEAKGVFHPGSRNFSEASGKALMLYENVDNYLRDHRSVKRDPALLEMAVKASNALYDLWQAMEIQEAEIDGPLGLLRP